MQQTSDVAGGNRVSSLEFFGHGFDVNNIILVHLLLRVFWREFVAFLCVIMLTGFLNIVTVLYSCCLEINPPRRRELCFKPSEYT
jgi:hypothetical protein